MKINNGSSKLIGVPRYESCLKDSERTDSRSCDFNFEYQLTDLLIQIAHTVENDD